MSILPTEKSASEVLNDDRVKSLINNTEKKNGIVLNAWEMFTLVRARIFKD